MERNKYGVRVGQVWKDNDPRVNNRLLRVVEVDLALGRAKCDLTTERKKGGKGFVHVRLSRFDGTKRGYSLVEREENG